MSGFHFHLPLHMCILKSQKVQNNVLIEHPIEELCSDVVQVQHKTLLVLYGSIASSVTFLYSVPQSCYVKEMFPAEFKLVWTALTYASQ